MEAMLTGALHEDALADTCDALGGGWTRDRIIEIMKCSQLGSYGVIALVIGVEARATAMAAIGEHSAIWALVSIAAAAAVGRMAMLCLMVTTQPISESSATTKDIAGAQNARRLLTALGIGSPFWIGWLAIDATVACASLAVALAVLYWFRRNILKTLGGTTGDLLGCSAFIAQLIILIGASLK
jgi:adenosylcobinamide-GDP ribazoletransferase